MAATGETQGTALVFAGGGSFGAIQVGMLKALVAIGVQPDIVLGASVGAINGAYFASDPTPDGVAGLERLWRGVNRNDVFPVSFASLARFAWRRDCLVDPTSLRRLIADNLPFRNIEQARLPLRIIATDLLTGAPVVLDRGDAVDAIMASAAIPVLFPPVVFGNRALVDGAISSNTPLKIAAERGAQRIIVLPTGYACALERPPLSGIGTALHAITILVASQLVREIETLSPAIDVRIVPPLCPLDGSPYDFTNTAALIESGEARTRAWIAAGGLDRRGVPDALRPHAHHH